MLGPAIAGGLGSVASSAVSTAGSLYMQKRQQDYSERAFKNRHQWEVADLRKAGLNPILSAHGNPGSAGGAAGTMPKIENPVSSAMMVKKLALENQGQQKQNEILQNQADIGAIERSMKTLGYDLMWKNPALMKAVIYGNLLAEPSSTAKNVGIGLGAAGAGIGQVMNSANALNWVKSNSTGIFPALKKVVK